MIYYDNKKKNLFITVTDFTYRSANDPSLLTFYTDKISKSEHEFLNKNKYFNLSNVCFIFDVNNYIFSKGYFNNINYKRGAWRIDYNKEISYKDVIDQDVQRVMRINKINKILK